MAFYREIHVNGVDYKYRIGKTFTKIVDVGSFLNEKICVPEFISEPCECGCHENESTKYKITPAVIERIIKERVHNV